MSTAEVTLVRIAKYEIGNKWPATLVLDRQTTAWMDRYVLYETIDVVENFFCFVSDSQ